MVLYNQISIKLLFIKDIILARKPADQSVNRDDIITAAADVLRRNGYEATTMKDIAAQVNLTAASLYHHFTNKDALLLAVLEAGLDLVTKQIAPVVESDMSNADKLREMIRIHITNVTSNTAVGAAMVFEVRPLMNATLYPGKSTKKNTSKAEQEFIKRRNAFFERRDDFERLFRAIITDGIERKEFCSVDVPVFVKGMLGAHNWVAVWYREGGRLSGEDIAEIMSNTFLRSLHISHPK